MKTSLIALIVFVGFGYAQEGAGQAPDKPAQPGGADNQAPKVLVRRLESVSWNPVRAELSWLVSVWDVDVSIEQPAARERYVMHLDDAKMEFQGESRPIDNTEAKHVRSLMDLISTYAVESTVWWDHGEDSTSDGQGTPSTKDGDGTKTKTDGPEEKDKPAPKATPVPARGSAASAASAQPGDASTPSRAQRP
jgi:hypothetical protein